MKTNIKRIYVHTYVVLACVAFLTAAFSIGYWVLIAAFSFITWSVPSSHVLVFFWAYLRVTIVGGIIISVIFSFSREGKEVIDRGMNRGR